MWVTAVSLAGALVAAGLLAFNGRYLRQRRLLGRVPLRSLATARDGEIARFVGVAELHGFALHAPLSGRECMFYSLRVRRYWDEQAVEEIEEARGIELTLDDGSGRAIVEARAAIGFPRRVRAVTRYPDELDAREQVYAQGALPRRYRRFELEEAIIPSGTRVAVVGRLVRSAGELRLVPAPDQPVVISVARTWTRIRVPVARVRP